MRGWLSIVAVVVLSGPVPVLHGASATAHTTDELARLIEAAGPGGTVRPEPGVYAGVLRLSAPVTLEGRGVVTIAGPGEGNVIEVTSPGVTLRGLKIRGSGTHVAREPAGVLVTGGPVVIEACVLTDVLFGLDLRQSPGSVVRGNRITGMDYEPGRRGDGIRLWWSHGCTVENNTITRSRDMVFWYSENLTVRRNRVEHSRYGLHFMYSHHTTLSENTLVGNSVGIYLMYSNGITIEDNTLAQNRGASGYGLGLKDCDDIIVRRNRILANRVGAFVDNCPSSVDALGLIEDNAVAYNETGLLMTPNTHDLVITGNGFIENEEQAGVHGRGDLALNTFSRDGRGNYWSNYPGFDLDEDGVGDLPYHAVSLFENLLAREPDLRLFVHSPAQQAIEFTARALPSTRPAPKFTDPAPLMSPPRLAGAGIDPPARGAMAAVAFVLSGAGGLVVWWCSRAPRFPRGRGLMGGAA